MATSKSSSNKTSSSTTKKPNQNYSTSLADGRSVKVVNGVKTYSDKPLNVTGKGGISISGKDYSVSKGGTGFAPKTDVINAEALKPVAKLDIPTPTYTPVSDFSANNVGLTNPDLGITQTGNMLSVAEPKQETDPLAGLKKANEDYQRNILNLGEDRTTGADIQRQLEKETGLKKLRQQVGNYSAQLNTITANRDAAMLSLEGQGRGQTQGFIGGEQARINREAAIQALPVQAQLAGAQGNLELAQSHINTWGQILMNDANNEYNNKKELYTSIRDYTVGIETIKLNKLEKENDRIYAAKQDLIKAKTAALSNALGQGAPASVRMAIEAATTPEQVVAAAGIYNGDILAREAQRASIANIYDQMAARKTALREAAVSASTEQQKAQAKQTADTEQALELKKLSQELKEMKGKGAAVGVGFKKTIVGAIPFVSGDAVAGSSRADFEAKAERVANLLTLDNLDLMSGVLSETDIKILETAGSNLRNFDQSEQSYNAEIDRIISTMDRTIKNNGITPEQAVFWGTLEPNEVDTFNSIWETL